MGPFALYAVFYSVGAIYTLISRWRQSRGVTKQQLRFVLTGILIMLSLIILTILIPVLINKNLSFVPFAPIYTLIFLSFTAYAIIKHRLMDIRLLVARTASYALLVLLIAGIYTALLFVIGGAFFNIRLSPVQLSVFALITLFAGFSFHPLQRMLEKITDRIFFKDRYDTDTMLRNLSNIMASRLRLDEITHGILEELLSQLRITKGAFILFEDGQIADVRSQGFLRPPFLDEEEIKVLSNTRNTLIFDELEEGKEKDILRQLQLTIAVHLRTEGKQIGLLVLGEKASGEIYAQQDLQLLEILSGESAVAIQNALSFEEIRRFNITLKEEVNRATRDLQAANGKLELLDKLKDEFVSLASHELRTPMTAIKSYTWLVLNNKAGALEPKAKEYINRVYISTERLIRLVNEMLNVSRIESGKTQLNREQFDMQKLLTDVQNEFQAKANELHLHWLIETPGTLPEISGDREKIHQVLENLVGNAFKFTPADGTIKVATTIHDAQLEVIVSDTGRGIAPFDLPKLFSKFGRIEGSYTTITGSGSGLGLYISKQYIELHGGKIWAESEPGKGSLFRFTIPLTK